MPIEPRDLLDKIREVRKKKKISTTRLAKKIGISQGYFSSIESGRSRCPLPLFLKICTMLKIDIALVLEGSELSKIYLTEDEKKLLDTYRGSAKKVQNTISNILEILEKEFRKDP